MRLPLLQLLLGVCENLSSLTGMSEWLAHIAWHDGSVIEEVQKTTAVFGKNDLLLSSLDGGSEV
jgi:hypothetical protein